MFRIFGRVFKRNKSNLEMSEKMINSISNYELSTHTDGRPSNTLITKTIFFMIFAGIFLWGAYLLFTAKWQIETPFIEYLPPMFFIFGIISLIAGIVNLSLLTIKVNEKEIMIIRGNNENHIPWDKIEEIRNTITFFSTLSAIVYNYGVVIIKTRSKTFKIKTTKFRYSQLRELFINLAQHAIKFNNIIINDELGWLPAELKSTENIRSGAEVRLKEYSILLRIGGIMIVIGAISFIFIPFIPNIAVLGVVFLFLGLMCVLTAWLGINEEKKKIEH